MLYRECIILYLGRWFRFLDTLFDFEMKLFRHVFVSHFIILSITESSSKKSYRPAINPERGSQN